MSLPQETALAIKQEISSCHYITPPRLLAKRYYKDVLQFQRLVKISFISELRKAIHYPRGLNLFECEPIPPPYLLHAKQ